MTHIQIMQKGGNYWDKTIALAERCSWRAGPMLAEKMRRNDFSDTERVVAAVIDDEVAGFCTFALTDELSAEYGFTPFCGFVFVDEEHRGKRLSEKMIDAVSDYAASLGYEKLYIMSGEVGLYEKYGFTRLGDYMTIYGTIDGLFVRPVK